MSYKACALAVVGALTLVAANQAQAITMADLTAPDAGPLVVGDKIFTNFTYSSVLMPADQVAVNTVSSPNIGLQFTAGWNTAYAGIMDSVIGYTVTVQPGSGNVITGANLSMKGLVVTGGGTAFVGETLTDPSNGNKEYKLQAIYNGSNQNTTSASTVVDPGTTTLVVIKDITVTPVLGNEQSFAAVTFVDNTFVQSPGGGTPPPIPEPMSLALLPLGLIGLGLRKKLAR